MRSSRLPSRKGAQMLSVSVFDYPADTLPDLPANARCVIVSNAPAISSLPPWPSGCKDIVLHDCIALETIPPLPEGACSLVLSNALSLRRLPPWPSSMRLIAISGCPLIEQIPPLPEGVKYLTVFSCASLRQMPALPEGITTVQVERCPMLAEKRHDGPLVAAVSAFFRRAKKGGDDA